MNDNEFIHLAENTLEQIETALEKLSEQQDLDIDLQRNDNVLTVRFENDTRLVINSQGAVKELWVAAPSGGYHFRHEDGQWVDTRDRHLLWTRLSELVSAQANRPISLVLYK